MRPVDLVTIDKLIPIYKSGVEANSIQIARVRDSEGTPCEFNVVVGKDLYRLGEQAVYVQPDYCIPPTELFNEYYAPGGDEKKSKLGKGGRVRAVKFNFQFLGESDPIYSNGILVPMYEFTKVFPSDVSAEGLQELLGVVKYEAPDSSDAGSKSGLTQGDRPYFLYETDETRIELLRDHADMVAENGEVVCGTVKVDGSSITIFAKDENGSQRVGVCSRKQEKKLDQTYVEAYRDGEYLLHPYLNKDTGERGWYNDFTKTFYTADDVRPMEPVMVEARDAWVDTVKKFGYLDKLIHHCRRDGVQLALRGELVGGGMKGSGNKLNMDAKSETHIRWFGVDDLGSGVATRIHYGMSHNLKEVCEDLGFEYTLPVVEGVMNYDQIIAWSNDYFRKVKAETGQVIEGLVFRTKYSNNMSLKYINPEYDANS